MHTHKDILKKVGIVLIVVGVLDICYLVYCLINGLSYSSSLNIFALIAGVFLFRGSLKAARLVGWFAAFMIAAAVSLVPLIPLWLPIDYLSTLMRLQPFQFLSSLFVMLLLLGILAWIYMQLSSRVVLAAVAEAGLSTWKTITALLAGFGLAAILATAGSLFMGGAIAKQAIQKVSESHGPSFKYFVSQLNVSTGSETRHIRAVVVGYNDNEISEFDIAWDD